MSDHLLSPARIIDTLTRWRGYCDGVVDHRSAAPQLHNPSGNERLKSELDEAIRDAQIDHDRYLAEGKGARWK